MKQKIPAGVFVAVIVVVVVGVLYFGWHAVTGGPNADITQESIKRYQGMVEQAKSHKPTSPQDAAKYGAPVGGGGSRMGSAPMGGTAPMGSAPMGSAPMGSAPMGGPGR